MSRNYLDIISLTERLHRQVLELVKLELDRLGVHDINSVQAMMLFHVGDFEMTVGELTLRGCYLGTNVSYNLKKMVEIGYLAQERSMHDRRSIHVKLTKKGREICRQLDEMYRKHIEMLGQAGITDAELTRVATLLGRLERFWLYTGDLASRQGRFAA